MPTTIELVVNGDRRRLEGVNNASDLLAALSLDPRAVVIELNRTIVRRHALGSTPVAAGDVVEIVHFVGGG